METAGQQHYQADDFSIHQYIILCLKIKDYEAEMKEEWVNGKDKSILLALGLFEGDDKVSEGEDCDN